MFPADIKACEALEEYWGREIAEKIFLAAFTTVPTDDVNTFDDFLKYCTACGGDWGQMILTGIKILYPDVYNVIPDDMGVNAFAAFLNVLVLCGVEI